MDAGRRALKAKGEATANAIVDVAADLLVEVGFHKLTMGAISARLGLSEGAPYQYFPNKLAIVAAVSDRWRDEFIEAFEAGLSGAGSGALADTIELMVEGHMAAVELGKGLHETMHEISWRIGLADRFGAVSRATSASIEKWLDHHRNEIKPDLDVRVAAAIIERLLTAVALPPRVLPHDRLGPETAKVIHSYLKCVG